MKKLILLVAILITGICVNAQSTYPTLDVKGESKIFQEPDIVVISVNVSTKANEYEACLDKNFSAIDRLKKSLKLAKIESLKIFDVGQRINEEKTYSSGKQIPDGYRANYSIKLKLEAKPKTIHSCLEVLKSSDVELNFNANYGLSPELIKATEAKLIAMAVSDAKTKAKILAESAEVQLKSIQNINYGTVKTIYGPKQHMAEMRVSKTGYSGSQSFTNPDPIVLTDHVEITYLLVE
ncbi:SIMPL domain-containing protein [Marinifilum flexuosum]|uniref:SIMPL domain-containing protein n=1 Tax=Marinifilum flexuosum TaxID=1117708 RepID=UPI0024945F39|nr:SIMPL domain-containing protein [Marinifilum flexuosum]